MVMSARGVCRPRFSKRNTRAKIIRSRMFVFNTSDQCTLRFFYGTVAKKSEETRFSIIASSIHGQYDVASSLACYVSRLCTKQLNSPIECFCSNSQFRRLARAFCSTSLLEIKFHLGIRSGNDFMEVYAY